MKYFESSYYLYVENTNWVTYLIFFCLFASLAMYLMQIIIHELGHCFFGLLTGYELVSFRIFQLTMVKLKGKWQFKRYKMKGSIGQCLMIPSRSKEMSLYALYTLGGCFSNLIIGIVAFLILLSPLSLSFLIRIALLFLALYGFGFAFLNGIPLNNLVLDNDGTNFVHMLQCKNTRKSSILQLEILKYLMEGTSYGQLPLKYITLPPNCPIENSILGFQKLIEYYHYLELNKLVKANQCLNSLYASWDNLNQGLKTMVDLEFMYLSMVIGKKKFNLKLYDKYRELLENESYDLHLLRIKLVCELSIYPKESKTQRILELFNKRRQQYPYPGEAIFSERILARIMNKGVKYHGSNGKIYSSSNGGNHGIPISTSVYCSNTK